MSDQNTPPNNIMELAANIVSAYVSNNTVAANDLAGLIYDVHKALGGAPAVTDVNDAPSVPSEPQKPAVNPKKSISPDYLICLEDGKKFKSLKRHLRTQYGLSPEDYKEKWGLPRETAPHV